MKEKDLHSYWALMTQFESGAMGAPEFERGYLSIFKDDSRDFPEAVYEILNGLFYAVDAYVPDPDLREDGDLDELQLQEACSRARVALEGLLS